MRIISTNIGAAQRRLIGKAKSSPQGFSNFLLQQPIFLDEEDP